MALKNPQFSFLSCQKFLCAAPYLYWKAQRELTLFQVSSFIFPSGCQSACFCPWHMLYITALLWKQVMGRWVLQLILYVVGLSVFDLTERWFTLVFESKINTEECAGKGNFSFTALFHPLTCAEPGQSLDFRAALCKSEPLCCGFFPSILFFLANFISQC